MTRISPLALAAVFLFSITPAPAQNVRLRGYGEADLHAVLRSALDTGTLVITRDTLIAPFDTVRSDVLVLGARLLLDGTIIGNLTGVQANMYLRPRAVVTGSVTNIAGGVYPSELAKTGSLDDRALAPYQLVRTGDDFTIEGTVRLPALSWIGGAQLPDYNRVDGLRVEVGPSLSLPPILGLEPRLSGSIGYATEREEVLGRAQLTLKHGRSTMTGGWEDDITRTNEDWIRSGLSNSLSFIWNGKDYRDYYETDRVFIEFRRVLERGARTSQYWIRGQNELAHPLVPGDPFVIWKPDSVRSNLSVSASRIASAIVGAQSEWLGATTAWNGSVALEFAGRVLDAEPSFNAYAANVEYAMRAIANHTLHIEANFRGPLPGTEDLPLQRWTLLGGSGTLYTFPVAAFRGDRLAFIETEYRIPFRRELKLPVLGRPTLRLLHNIGSAWSRLDDRAFEQNIGVRLQFPLAYVRVVTNPERFTDDVKFTVGVSTPSKSYSWEKPTRGSGR